MSNLEYSRAERLDQYVSSKFPTVSRAYVSKLIDNGIVRVNGEIQTKSGYKIRSTDEIEIDFDVDELQVIPEIDIPVIFEDDDCVVISKPRGVLSHSKGSFNPEGTVASWLRSKVDDIGGDRAGIVHRLDRATSGVMICAKNKDAQSWLQKQFSLRKVKKIYTAVVVGKLEPVEAIIEMPIERNPKKPQTFRVGSNGKSAVTAYKVLSTNGSHSLVELSPTTGRTHQLRVHMAKLGHPILGDELYGGGSSDRLFLHAKSLEITIPSRERKIFTVPVPDEFSKKVSSA